MAVPSYTTDLSVFNNCTSLTNFTEFTGYTSGSKEGIDPDLAIYGTVCLSASNRAAAACSLGYTGTAMTLGTNGAVFIWQKFFAPNSLDTETNGGIVGIVGNSSGNFSAFTMDGSDSYPYGGWKCYAIDPTETALPNETPTGTPNTTYSAAGIGWKMINGISKGNALTLDIIRYGRGESRFTGGETADYATFDGFATVNDNPTTGRWGLFQKEGESYLYKGLMSLGLTATAVDMRDSNVTINIENTKAVNSAFNRIEVHNASSNVEWTSILITALGTLSKGEFEMIDNATVDMTTCVFTDMSTFIFQSNATVDSTSFIRCGSVTQDGATFTDCIFTESTATSALIIDDFDLVTNANFLSDGSSHAIELTSIGTGSMDWAYTTTGYETGVTGSPITPTTTGNEDIYITATTASDFTISVAAGDDPPSVRVAAGFTGDVNVVAAQTTITFNVSPSITNYEYALYTVTAKGSLAGKVEVQHVEVHNSSTITYTYTYAAGTILATQLLFGDGSVNDYEESVTYYDLSTTDQSFTINLEPDYNN